MSNIQLSKIIHLVHRLLVLPQMKLLSQRPRTRENGPGRVDQIVQETSRGTLVHLTIQDDDRYMRT